jgi:cardiolipin synthase A/B
MDAKSFVVGFAFCLLLIAVAYVAANALAPTSVSGQTCADVQPLFSPDSSSGIISLMRSAQKTIDVEMYVFTDDALARELADAQKRGVEVRVILEPRVDSTPSTKTIPDALLAAGVEVRWASLQYALTHSKMMIVDGKKVLVGSINFSKNAQHKNREAAAILDCADEAAQYSSVFEKDWADAMAIQPS